MTTTSDLSFRTLRAANAARLPQFKNCHGGLAHSTSDGHDWSPAQWFQATLGELGEFAKIRLAYETGQITYEVYAEEAAKEQADFITYADILARRSLDEVELSDGFDDAQGLMAIISMLGEYANARKKFDRGDLTLSDFSAMKTHCLQFAKEQIEILEEGVGLKTHKVIVPHSTGIDLGKAVADKFNEVSDRVGSSVKIDFEGDWFHDHP